MLDLTGNFKAFARSLSRAGRNQVPFAIALTLSATADDIEKNTGKSLSRRLDRPTPFTRRGQPLSIRVDNGPENVSAVLQMWASRRGIGLDYIQPGKPQQNAYVERYNRTFRHEWIGQYIFETIEEAQDHATRWLWTYNNERPNMAIGGITPAVKLKTVA